MKKLSTGALSNMSLSKAKGFTLIELVIVIVILGILAATAAPKFINLTGDARESVMSGVQGSINSAVNIAHAKALIEGQTADTGEIQIGSLFYALVYGYPAAAGVNAGDGTTGNGLPIGSLVELEDGSEITVSDATPSVFQHSGAGTAANCQLSYANAADSETPPVITPTLSTDGCS